ncbi:MAG: DUF533 domain-containing protein [Myxococcota bacterium]
MHEQDKAIVQGLVSVAWADGSFDAREREMLEALLEAFGADDDEAKAIRDYAATQRGLEDIPLNELSYGDRRNLYNHAVALSWIDGDQAEAEIAFLDALRDRLNITAEEATDISAVATARAKALLEAAAAG